MPRHDPPDPKTLISDHWLDFLLVRDEKVALVSPRQEGVEWARQLEASNQRINGYLEERRQIGVSLPDLAAGAGPAVAGPPAPGSPDSSALPHPMVGTPPIDDPTRR